MSFNAHRFLRKHHALLFSDLLREKQLPPADMLHARRCSIIPSDTWNSWNEPRCIWGGERVQGDVGPPYGGEEPLLLVIHEADQV